MLEGVSGSECYQATLPDALSPSDRQRQSKYNHLRAFWQTKVLKMADFLVKSRLTNARFSNRFKLLVKVVHTLLDTSEQV